MKDSRCPCGARTDSGNQGTIQPRTGLLKAAYLAARRPGQFQTGVDLAEGEYVAMRNTFSGTHRGPFMGAAPTGKQVSQQQMPMVRVQHGQVVEHTAVRDDLALLEQLGAIERR